MNNTDSFYLKTIKGIAERASGAPGDDFDKIVEQCKIILENSEKHYTGLPNEIIVNHITRGAGID